MHSGAGERGHVMATSGWPFASAEKWAAGWYAVTAGMCSGPYITEREAQQVADVWNKVTSVAPRTEQPTDEGK